jgi:hypothetical protein
MAGPRALKGGLMKVVQDDLWFCECCTLAAVNGDLCECDHHAEEVEAGADEFGPHLVPDFDSETGEGIEEFTRWTCDCCKSPLHGKKHRFAVLGEGKEEDDGK